MHLRCACVAEELDYPCYRCASDDRIVDEHDTLALHRFGNGIELYPDALLPLRLNGDDEGSAAVFILNETYFIGNTRLL